MGELSSCFLGQVQSCCTAMLSEFARTFKNELQIKVDLAELILSIGAIKHLVLLFGFQSSRKGAHAISSFPAIQCPLLAARVELLSERAQESSNTAGSALSTIWLSASSRTSGFF